MIQPVTPSNLMQAAAIHAESWQASHRAICTPEFLALHTPERQARYLESEMDKGARLYLLTEEKPVGIVLSMAAELKIFTFCPVSRTRGMGRGC